MARPRSASSWETRACGRGNAVSQASILDLGRLLVYSRRPLVATMSQEAYLEAFGKDERFFPNDVLNAKELMS